MDEIIINGKTVTERQSGAIIGTIGAMILIMEDKVILGAEGVAYPDNYIELRTVFDLFNFKSELLP